MTADLGVIGPQQFDNGGNARAEHLIQRLIMERGVTHGVTRSL